MVTAPSPYTAGANKCDPGTLSSGGLTDTLVRINAYRWLVGAGDTVTDDADEGHRRSGVRDHRDLEPRERASAQPADELGLLQRARRDVGRAEQHLVGLDERGLGRPIRAGYR